jgi:hypothetical protein
MRIKGVQVIGFILKGVLREVATDPEKRLFEVMWRDKTTQHCLTKMF